MKGYKTKHNIMLLKPNLFLVFSILFYFLNGPAFADPPSNNLISAITLEKVNVDIRNNKYGKISSIIIYNGNRVYYEKYYGFSQQSTLHPISSVTKSITSLAVGVCIDKGYIPSTDVLICDYFPEYEEIFKKDPLKKQITLKHLLAQTSGLTWNEWTVHYSYAGNQLIELSQNPSNWCDAILNLPILSPPGESFSYNSGCSELIKEIICRSTGRDFEEFVKTEILNKIGIFTIHWDKYQGNGAPAWGGISLNTRDMARIGLLILNQGKWGDTQIVSSKWIEQSTIPIVNAGIVDYGLHWWVGTQPDGNPLIYAAGYGDQYVYIAPDKNLVIAFNGQNFTDHKWEKNHHDLVMDILNAYNQ